MATKSTVLKDKDGTSLYPVTDVSLVVGLQEGAIMKSVVVSQLPTADATTVGTIYMVPSATVTGEYDRYMTTYSNSAYTWTQLGSTAIPSPVIADNLTTNDATQALSAKQGKVLNDNMTQLGQEVDELNTEIKTNPTEYPTSVGSIIGRSGLIDPAVSSRGVSDFIPFTNDTILYNVFIPLSNYYTAIAVYDSAKNFISGLYPGTASSTLSSYTLYKNNYPTGAFIRFSVSSPQASCSAFSINLFSKIPQLLQDVSALDNQVGDYDDIVFRLLRENINDVTNLADFDNYTSADVPYNVVGSGSYTITFNGNEMTAQQSANVGGVFAVDLAKLGLIDEERYLIAIKRSKKTTLAIRLVRDVTASSPGINIADFTNGDFYFYLDYTAAPNRYILFSQLYTETSITYDFTIYKITDIVISHKRKNYAELMSWTPLGETANTISATKNDEGVVITTPGGANAVGRFLLPQLKNGHNYSFTIQCSTLLADQTIGSTVDGANKYVFTSQGDGVYTLEINNYQEVYFPLYLRLLLKYSSTTHTIKFTIIDKEEQVERDIVLNDALYGIDEQNLSDGLLERCDYLQDNPTLYRGMDIMAFNKGICIGDSITAGSLNTTDSQGSSGPNVPADPTKAYPAKLSKMTGIELTNAGDGGQTSYGYYAAHQNDDWSGNEFAIILLGINDVSSIGHRTWDSDSVDAFTNIINKLKAENEGIKIFVSTIINTQSYKDIGGGVNEGIIQLVEDLNDPDVILLDMHKYGRLNLSNAYSCGHPSQYGYYRMAQDYCNYISWYMATHKEEFRFIQFIGTNYVYTKDF